MASTISLTVSQISGDGDYAPTEGLQQSAFKFVLASDEITEVVFTGFNEEGNGNYTFSGFDVPLYEDELTDSYTESYQVKVKINDVLQDGYGVFTVYPDNREPVGKGYTDGRLHRGFTGQNPNSGCDTVFGLVQYDDTVDLGTLVPTNASLVHKKWVTDNFASLADTTAGSWSIQTNRLFVDSKLPANVTGKKYQTISDALTYATNQTPTANSRWTIFVMPNHGSYYYENITIPDYINLVGIGKVFVLGHTPRSSSVAGTTSRIENFYFQVSDTNLLIYRLYVKDCIFQTLVGEVSGGIITLSQSVLDNVGLYGHYDDEGNDVQSANNNTIISAYGNYNVVWQSTDKVYDYTYLNGDTYSI